MRVIFSYGIIGGGGCEKRMGDLVRWLLANGDEAWIVGTQIYPAGIQQLFEQQNVPRDRVILYDPDSAPDVSIEGFHQFIVDACHDLRADILDIQCDVAAVEDPPCDMIYTLHGTAQPIPQLPFDGILSVEEPFHPRGLCQWKDQLFTVVPNWVDIKRFPFRRELGKGACFIGRNFKAVNVFKVAEFWKGTIDCYGIQDAPIDDYPENMCWLGYADPAEILPKYRVVFGSAQVALEALAVGRFVIAGQHYVEPPSGVLVTPKNIGLLAANQFYNLDKSGAGIEPTREMVYEQFKQALGDDAVWMRRKLHRYVKKHHHMAKQMPKVRRFYEEVLA